MARENDNDGQLTRHEPGITSPGGKCESKNECIIARPSFEASCSHTCFVVHSVGRAWWHLRM